MTMRPPRGVEERHVHEGIAIVLVADVATGDLLKSLVCKMFVASSRESTQEQRRNPLCNKNESPLLRLSVIWRCMSGRPPTMKKNLHGGTMCEFVGTVLQYPFRVDGGAVEAVVAVY